MFRWNLNKSLFTTLMFHLWKCPLKYRVSCFRPCLFRVGFRAVLQETELELDEDPTEQRWSNHPEKPRKTSMSPPAGVRHDWTPPKNLQSNMHSWKLAVWTPKWRDMGFLFKEVILRSLRFHISFPGCTVLIETKTLNLRRYLYLDACRDGRLCK